MANCKKATRGAMGHLMKHYERSRNENGEYIKFGNQQIDTGRTYLNYNLAPEHDQLDFIHKRLSEVYVLNRKDVNVMCSWVITAPKELPEEYHREFFERTYHFLRERYSQDERNIISSYVHMDEVTPHMHFAFVPVVYDEKKDREKVSAKEVVNRTDLKTFHKDFQKVMDRFARERGNVFKCNVLNGATASGNKSIEEYKAEKVKKQNQRLNEKNQDLKKLRALLLKELGGMENRLAVLDTAIGSNEAIAKEFVNNPRIKPIFEEYRNKKQEIIADRIKQRESVRSVLARNQEKASGNKQSRNRSEERYKRGGER